ncbi:MAG: glutathione S-transferase family protein, partial [Methyloligellaceae bacterium]
ERVQARTAGTQTAAFARLNPCRKIPVLQDGDVTLTESAAIVTYLAERYSGAKARLIPEDPAARAHYHEWVSFVCMEIDATSLYVLRRHEYLPEVYGEAPAAVEASKAYLARMLEAAAVKLEDGRAYLLGRDFSGADILMTTCLDWATRYGQTVPAPFQAYRERVAARPGYAAARIANESP